MLFRTFLKIHLCRRVVFLKNKIHLLQRSRLWLWLLKTR
ncbi:unnamed protein product, partial [Brassica oleracea]